jgi:hypothetical protein
MGSLPIEEAWARVRPVVSADNAMTERFLIPHRLAVPEIDTAVGILAQPTALDVTLESNGRLRTVRLEPVPYPVEFLPELGVATATASNVFWKDADKNYWFSVIPQTNALYVQFNSARDDVRESLADFSARLDRQLADPQILRVIVDLRRNIGGDWHLTMPLIRSLVRAGYDRPGRLVLITGPATISAATVFAVELRLWLDPIVIGLPSGSSPNQYGEIVFFELPRSHVRVGYAAAFFQTAGYENMDPWIVPDIAVDTSGADYFARRDPVLAAALAAEAPEPLETLLGRTYARSGLDGAMAAYDSYQSDPRNHYLDTERALRRFAGSLAAGGHPQDALRVHRRNVADHPDRARAALALADALLASGNAESARPLFRAAQLDLAGDRSLNQALRTVLSARLEALLGPSRQ